MPRRAHVRIVTVGASLLSNALRDDQRVRSLIGEVSGLKGVEAALRSGAVDRDALVSALVSYIGVKGDAASAELNSMSEHLASGNVSRVYLLHTDTMVGEVCGLALERHLRRRGVTVERIRVEGFKSEAEFWERGLQDLLLKAHELVKKHENEVVMLNATGGFKPEGAALSILAFLMRRPVYYRHEDFMTTVYIPPLPIEWREEVLDGKFRSPLTDLLKMGSMDAAEFERKYGADVKEKMVEDFMLIRERDGKVELTALGKLIYRVTFS